MENRRAFIFANGERTHSETIQAMSAPGDYRVAADGGLRFMQALNWKPDLLIGDLDSLSAQEVEAVRAAGVEVRQYPIHKNETDLELALDAALKAGCREIRIVGALGGRLDMTLGNIFLLMLPDLVGLDVCLDDGYEEVLLIYPSGQVEITGESGDRVSLLPLNGPAIGVRTIGLYYPLHNETLFPEHTRGISNVMEGGTASVALESGLLVCIHSRRVALLEEINR